jgi:riboflavin synthase
VASRRGSKIIFDVMTETLRKTALGKLAKGDAVNIERSLKAGQRIDGHFVQGHVEGVGSVVKKVADGKDYKLTIKPPGKLMKYIAPLGSISVNGVSLTVASLTRSTFTVALIPTTLKLTTLGALVSGDIVNIETDMVARQVVRYLETYDRARHTTGSGAHHD